MTGLEEVITPFPVPWLGLRGDFSFGALSLGVTAAFLDGRSSLLSGFLFAALMTVLGVDEVSPPASFPFFSSFLRPHPLLSRLHLCIK